MAAPLLHCVVVLGLTTGAFGFVLHPGRPSPSPSSLLRRETRDARAPLPRAGKGGGFGEMAKKTNTKTAKAGGGPAPASSSSSAKAGGGGPIELTKVDVGAQFMGGWVISDESVVDDLVAVFEARRSAGNVAQGMVSMKGGTNAVVNKEVKESLEMNFAPNDPNPAWRRYLQALSTTMQAYLAEHPMAGAYGKFGLTSATNLQFYPPGGGYKTYHTERTGRGEPEGSRHLVFMTYLNDVTDQGGTEFYHQNVTVQPVKGLTLIWPSDWTFTHRGVPSPSQEKSIVTGWFNFN